MSLVVALNDINPENVAKPHQRKPGSPGSLSTSFFRTPASDGTPHAPTAALNRYPAGEARYSAAHFHTADQFQLIMEGSGSFGRHRVEPYCIHFSRAYTPYGPLQSDAQSGWAFMLLRSRFDPGAQRFPAAREKLRQMPDRKPWQVMAKASFPPAGPGIRVQEVPGIRDDQGLFASTMTMASGTRTMAPDPSQGDGQYVVVVKGSLIHEGRERQAPAVIFIKPDEKAFAMHAGAQGLEAIIMNFPRVTSHRATAAVQARTPSAAAAHKVWQCQLCAFAYDEALGLPGEGIAAGTRWADVPDDWTCPDCAAGKHDFGVIEI